MLFVDRISEQARLKKALTRESVSFVVLYGRRRCGKSRLIRLRDGGEIQQKMWPLN
jgi:AAA+ ATPase superfamily predicted ATPase